MTSNETSLAAYEADDKLIWNPVLNGYVDKKLYFKALQTQDPTRAGYQGVSPNFGGGLLQDGEGLGSTKKKMKKLTTVLSKNQKLNSMNTPHKIKQFEHKSNLQNEMRRQRVRQHLFARDTFIEANQPYLEAIQETK